MKMQIVNIRHAVLASALLLSSNVLAIDYLIEVVLFETVAGRDQEAGGLYYPKSERSVNLNGDAAAQAGFAIVDEGLTLTENAASIAASSRYKLLRHIAWRQPGLDEDSALPVRISLGNTSTVYLPEDLGPYEEFIPASATVKEDRTLEVKTSTINGTIKVRLGRFLHMETLLVYTDVESQQGFRLSQSRKMRSRELHYIDNPRFGLLTRILPLEDILLEEAAPVTVTE